MNRPALVIVLLWIVFAMTHMVPSSARLRPRLVARLGTGPFLGLYSLVSLAIFAPLVVVYFRNRHSGALLHGWRAQPGVYTLAMAVAFAAVTLMVASVVQPSPTSIGGPTEARGLSRITRHPLFLSIGVLGLSHLLLHGHATDVAFFGGLTLFSMLGSLHQDHRQRMTRPELAELHASTSWLPFAAILAGRNRLVVRELPWVGLAVGAALAYGAWWLHVWLLGL